MGEEGVRDPGEPGERVAVAVGDGLVGEVPAGEHVRAGEVGGEQVVDRRVRQHEAESAVARRDGSGHLGAGAAGQQHDRALGTGEQPLGLGVQLAQRPRGTQVGDHDRERPLLAALAGAQGAGGLLVGGVDRQVIPAEPFDGQDAARSQHLHRRHDRIGAAVRTVTGTVGTRTVDMRALTTKTTARTVTRATRTRTACVRAIATKTAAVRTVTGTTGARVPRMRILAVKAAVQQAEDRAAGRAADRLGVEPAVQWVEVLPLALPAHGEPGHRGGGPVVGDVPDDGEPRPAVGAVDEGMAVTPVGGVEQFGQAVITCRDIG